MVPGLTLQQPNAVCNTSFLKALPLIIDMYIIQSHTKKSSTQPKLYRTLLAAIRHMKDLWGD